MAYEVCKIDELELVLVENIDVVDVLDEKLDRVEDTDSDEVVLLVESDELVDELVLEVVDVVLDESSGNEEVEVTWEEVEVVLDDVGVVPSEDEEPEPSSASPPSRSSRPCPSPRCLAARLRLDTNCRAWRAATS